MAVQVNINSYVSVAEADAYFEDRLDASAWNGSDGTRKGQSLVSATRAMERIQWIGTALSSSQVLSFPRQVEYFEPKFGMYRTFEGTPERIKDAVFELALHYLTNSGLLDETGTTQSISVGPIDLQTIKKPPSIPPVVSDLIKPLRANSSWAVMRSN